MSTPTEASAGSGASSDSGETLPSTLAPGTIIAERYRIDALIGEGGMGKVYAAEHVHMQKQVAIKVLHEEMSSTPEFVARFEREAVAAAKISHPNVATATDFGRLPNRSFYLVLEYVAGTDLRSILSGGSVPKDRAVRIVRQIVAAVGAAHAVGIIHRDLKPENVMVVRREDDPDFVKVLDFGIAKFDAMTGPSGSASGHQPLTKIGAIFGTPDYMSPEQALGQTIDGRSDLYSIGVIFHELLTGERLFKGGAVTLMRSHVLEEAPPLPPAVAQAIGPRLEAVIEKLLKKSPEERFASSAELLAALDAAVAPETHEERAATAAFPLVRENDPPRKLASTPPPARQSSVPSAPERAPSEPSYAPPRKRGSFGLTLLVLVAAGAGLVYVFGPPEFLAPLLQTVPSASSALSAAQSAVGAVDATSPSASASSAASASARPSDSAEASIAPAWSATANPDAGVAPAPSDSVNPDEPPPLPDDAIDAASPASSGDSASPTTPHPTGAHSAAGKPPARPTVHKPTKPTPTKHP